MRILFSNLGYAKGIDGTLWQHITRAGRHLYCPIPVQMDVLDKVRSMLIQQRPDIACFVEVDQGSLHTGYLDHLSHIRGQEYLFFDAANKYGDDNWRRFNPLSANRANAFIARTTPEFERLYFVNGTKRLVYKIHLDGGIVLLFAHFSLMRNVREKQFREIHDIISSHKGSVILMGDFNIMHGFEELSPLLQNTDLAIVNDETKPTFRFYNRNLILDLCLCSKDLHDHVKLDIIPQPYSDHEALLLDVVNV